MYTNQQIQAAKSVLITNYMASKEMLPYKEANGEYYYFSPFRTERTPSFCVNPGKNVFNDFADDNGDIIRLVQRLENKDFPGAVKFLLEFSGEYEITVAEVSTLPRSPQKQNLIKKVGGIHSQVLINYLESRKISASIARPFLSEVHYSTPHGDFFSLGFRNNSAGYELRNPKFKGCLGQKDITTLGNPNANDCLVFEGFFDFLSWRPTEKRLTFYCVHILNSTSLLSRLPDLRYYKSIGSYLDNDETGKKAYTALERLYPENLENLSERFFPQYQDYNEFLVKR